jgi:hypothetical protein
MTDILPDCKLREPKRLVFQGQTAWTPIFCANCGKDGGLVMESDVDFAFYLCDPCTLRWGVPAGCMATPDEVFWAKVKAAQIEEYGRELQPGEIIAELAEPNSIISKLAREKEK